MVIQRQRQSVRLMRWGSSLFPIMRIKEVFIFLFGYSVGQIGRLMKNIKADKMQQGKMIDEFSIESLYKDSLEELNKNVEIDKQQLVCLFDAALRVMKGNSDKIRGICNLNSEEVFRLLILEGLKIAHNFQSQRDLQLALVDLIYKKMINQHEQNKNQMDHPSLVVSKSDHLIQRCSQYKTQEKQSLCEICMCTFTTGVQIDKCGHQFHEQCLFQTIKQFLNSSSYFLLDLSAKQSFSEQDLHQQQMMTRIRCPNYESCSVYISLAQVHHLILNSQPQLLSKFYDLTFDSYLVKNKIATFDQLHDCYRKSQLSGVLQKEVLFYCKSPTCNAVYVMDQKDSYCNQHSISRQHNFICLSCRSPYCLNCFSSLHPTMTCKQHLISSSHLPEDQQLQKFIKTLKKPYKKCPKCRYYVQNWRGCSTVKCRCGTEFCFKCGNIGCPHAKCIKEIEKEQQQKIAREKQTKIQPKNQNDKIKQQQK